jgi:hypothetical protein
MAISASRLMRATSGRPMLEMYSFLSLDFLDGEGNHFQAHLGHVVGAGGADYCRPTISGSFTICSTDKLADDAAQVAFHDQFDEALDARRSVLG